MKVSDDLAKKVMIVGAVLLMISIICFVYAGTALNNLGGGRSITISELKEAEATAKMLGLSLSYITGVSASTLFFYRFCSVARFVLLVLGILGVGAGAVFHFAHIDPQKAARMEYEISNGVNTAAAVAKYGMSVAATAAKRGMSYAAAAAKETVEKTTCKCPNCGKILSRNTSFCPACGEKLIKPETGKRICPSCGKSYSEDMMFCLECGVRLTRPEPVRAIERPKEEPTYECPRCR